VVRFAGTLVSLCLGLAAGLEAQTTAIVAGRLLDPETGAIARNQTILVENGRITTVGSAPPPLGARVVDLSRYTVLPGLIDAHVHLAIGGPVRDNALADLRAGFTTVVDLGARTHRMLRIRDSINAGHIPGPRVLAAGIWVGTRGGVCEFNGIGIDGGPTAFAQRVRENAEAGADLIKVCVSGWPAASHARPDSFEIRHDALAAVVQEAKAAKRLVVAHDISPAGVRAALETGVNGLAHAAYLDSTLARAVARAGMFMIPTLASLTANDSSAVARDLVSGTATAFRAGVPIVFGTDGGVLPHGQNAAEFAALQRAGLSPIAVIRAATINAARALRIADSVGTIKAGMSADLIAVEGDPLTSLDALGRVRFVMLRGREVALLSPVAKPTRPTASR
jgi:imidazolonepropionase-like amidohydrolase